MKKETEREREGWGYKGREGVRQETEDEKNEGYRD